MNEGYVFMTSPCYVCDYPFVYNPHKVPSVRVAGVREPICLRCVNRSNVERIKNGLDPIIPLPGAYEPMPESEL